MLNGHQIGSKSTGKPFPEFLTNNNCLWSIIVRDNAVRTTQKSVSTTGSFNHGRIVFYNNSCATFQLAKLKLVGLIHPNPGPSMDSTTTANSRTSHHDSKAQLNISCLYMNARSIVNKADELQVLASNVDLPAITETWLTPEINSCEILPNMDFAIHRRDRFELNDQRGGGVLLVVRNTIPSLRRPDMETSAEIIVCELRPSCKKKILMAVFYRPPSSDCSYLAEFLKFLRKASMQDKIRSTLDCWGF